MRRNMRTWMVAAMALLLAGSAWASNDLWLHVKVDEGNDGATVRVNLPFALIEQALPLVPQKHLDDAWSHVEEMDAEIADLRAMWDEVKSSPDMTFVTVEEADEKVRVWKEGSYFHVRVEDGVDEQVVVKLPMAMMDALLAGDSFDLQGAFRVLADQGGGELVSVRDKNDTVRVWVDQTPEAE